MPPPIFFAAKPIDPFLRWAELEWLSMLVQICTPIKFKKGKSVKGKRYPIIGRMSPKPR